MSDLFDDLPDWLDREAWADFLEMRKAKGKRAPFTEGARKRVLSKLAAMHAQGIDTTQALSDSVVNAWSDVYPPKPAPVPTVPTVAKPSARTREAQAVGSVWLGRHARRQA